VYPAFENEVDDLLSDAAGETNATGFMVEGLSVTVTPNLPESDPASPKRIARFSQTPRSRRTRPRSLPHSGQPDMASAEPSVASADVVVVEGAQRCATQPPKMAGFSPLPQQ